MIRKSNSDPLTAKANAAFEEMTQDVIARARLAKTEVVVWRDGKIVKLSPDEMERELAERAAKPGTETRE